MDALVMNTLLPRVEPAAFLHDPLAVSLEEIVSQDGNVAMAELLILCGIAKEIRARDAFEIGTFDGRTTLNLAINIDPGGKVVTLDLPVNTLDQTAHAIEVGERKYIAKPQSGERFQNHSSRSRITQVLGDSATFDFAPFRLQFDLVFIDGSHAYEYTRSDSLAALELLRPGRRAAIVWHDYASKYWPGATRALDELLQTPEFKNVFHVKWTTLAVMFVG